MNIFCFVLEMGNVDRYNFLNKIIVVKNLIDFKVVNRFLCLKYNKMYVWYWGEVLWEIRFRR